MLSVLLCPQRIGILCGQLNISFSVVIVTEQRLALNFDTSVPHYVAREATTTAESKLLAIPVQGYRSLCMVADRTPDIGGIGRAILVRGVLIKT